MKKLCLLIIVIFLFSLLASCRNEELSSEAESEPIESIIISENEESDYSSSEHSSNGTDLLFEDNFDGNHLDMSKWQKCPEWDRHVPSRWRDNMSLLDGKGHLILRAEWDENDKTVNAGAIRTFGKFTASYGYYEAAVKFPVVKGVWGAFWIMAGNVQQVDNSSKDGVEIDIIESIGNESGLWNQALHWDGYGNDAKSISNDAVMNCITDIYDGEFHTFGLWRTEEFYAFYIDGEEVWRTVGGGICGEEGYLKLTVEAAEWAGAGTEDSINSLPAEMEVDYVRVWQTKPKD